MPNVTGDGAEATRGVLKRVAVGGIAITFASQIVRFGLQFLYQVLIARLLLPSDFGVVAMVAPILAFGSLFSDFGLIQATIQRTDISQSQLSLIFWANLMLSCAVAVVIIVASPLLSLFYHEPRVGPVAAVLGATFILSGLYGQHLAILNRRLEFVKLATVDLFGFLVGAVAGLFAALGGASYWAIVINQVMFSVASLCLAWALSQWLPSHPQKPVAEMDLFRFGGNVTAFNLFNYFARNLDNVLIGKFNGGISLGLYDRAYKLLLLPLSQVTAPFARVALPMLSRLRDDEEAYRRGYMRMIESVMLLTFPPVCFAMIDSQMLITTLLGVRWTGVAPIFAILAVGGLLGPIGNSTGWLFISQNRTREMRNWGVASAVLSVNSFVLGLHWGPVGVAACYIGVGVCQAPVLWWIVTRNGPLTFRHLVAGLAPYGLSAVVLLGVERALREALQPGLLALSLGGAAAYPIFVGALGTTPRGRAALSDVMFQLRGLLDGLGRFLPGRVSVPR